MKKEAYVTLVATDSYAAGALVLSHRLRELGSTKEIVCLVTPNVSTLVRNILSNICIVTVVDTIKSNDFDNLKLLGRPELDITFTKIQLWTLTQYDTLVFLDADTFPVKNVDDLFNWPSFSAAPDAGWPDCFNSGVFVTSPSNETFQDLMSLASKEGSFDGGDQGLLNTYFSSWSTSPSNRLPFTFNTTPTSQYGYAPAHNQYNQSISVVHFIGNNKPWKYQRFADGKILPMGDQWDGINSMVQSWWDVWDRYYGRTSPYHLLSNDYNRFDYGFQTSPIVQFDEVVQSAWKDQQVNLDHHRRHVDPMPPISNISMNPPDWFIQEIEKQKELAEDERKREQQRMEEFKNIERQRFEYEERKRRENQNQESGNQCVNWNPAWQEPPKIGSSANIPDLSHFKNAWDQPDYRKKTWVPPVHQPKLDIMKKPEYAHYRTEDYIPNRPTDSFRNQNNQNSRKHASPVFPWEKKQNHLPPPSRIWLDELPHQPPSHESKSLQQSYPEQHHGPYHTSYQEKHTQTQHELHHNRTYAQTQHESNFRSENNVPSTSKEPASNKLYNKHHYENCREPYQNNHGKSYQMHQSEPYRKHHPKPYQEKHQKHQIDTQLDQNSQNQNRGSQQKKTERQQKIFEFQQKHYETSAITKSRVSEIQDHKDIKENYSETHNEQVEFHEDSNRFAIDENFKTSQVEKFIAALNSDDEDFSERDLIPINFKQTSRLSSLYSPSPSHSRSVSRSGSRPSSRSGSRRPSVSNSRHNSYIDQANKKSTFITDTSDTTTPNETHSTEASAFHTISSDKPTQSQTLFAAGSSGFNHKTPYTSAAATPALGPTYPTSPYLDQPIQPEYSNYVKPDFLYDSSYSFHQTSEDMTQWNPLKALVKLKEQSESMVLYQSLQKALEKTANEQEALEKTSHVETKKVDRLDELSVSPLPPPVVPQKTESNPYHFKSSWDDEDIPSGLLSLESSPRTPMARAVSDLSRELEKVKIEAATMKLAHSSVEPELGLPFEKLLGQQSRVLKLIEDHSNADNTRDLKVHIESDTQVPRSPHSTDSLSDLKSQQSNFGPNEYQAINLSEESLIKIHRIKKEKIEAEERRVKEEKERVEAEERRVMEEKEKLEKAERKIKEEKSKLEAQEKIIREEKERLEAEEKAIMLERQYIIKTTIKGNESIKTEIITQKESDIRKSTVVKKISASSNFVESNDSHRFATQLLDSRIHDNPQYTYDTKGSDINETKNRTTSTKFNVYSTHQSKNVFWEPSFTNATKKTEDSRNIK